jgi:hypothetical protein
LINPQRDGLPSASSKYRQTPDHGYLAVRQRKRPGQRELSRFPGDGSFFFRLRIIQQVSADGLFVARQRHDAADNAPGRK